MSGRVHGRAVPVPEPLPRRRADLPERRHVRRRPAARSRALLPVHVSPGLHQLSVRGKVQIIKNKCAHLCLYFMFYSFILELFKISSI